MPGEEPQHETGHDVHFLSRLSRVTVRQSELALALYRWPEMVRSLLADAAVPEAADRVAIAIDAGAAPPHVVVARSGAFVTCLAEGMAPSGLPVVSFDRLRIMFEREALWLERAGAANAALSDRSGRKLFDRMVVESDTLSREEMRELVAIEPFLHGAFCDLLKDTMPSLVGKMLRAGAIREPRPRHEPFLRELWREHHLVRTLLVLCTVGGHRAFAHWAALGEAMRRAQPDLEERDPDSARFNPFFPLCDAAFDILNHRAVAVRMIWGCARAGKLALPWLRSRVGARQSPARWLGWSLTATTLGIAHHKLRRDSARMIAALAPPDEFRENEAVQWTENHLRQLAADLKDLTTSATDVYRTHWRLLAGRLGSIPLDVTNEPPERLDELMCEGSAADLAITRFCNEDLPTCAKVSDLVVSPPLLGVMPFEAFHWPRAHVAQLAQTFTPERAHRLAYRDPEPKPAPVRVGRNEPCPCGSGRKYKRCCGA